MAEKSKGMIMGDGLSNRAVEITIGDEKIQGMRFMFVPTEVTDGLVRTLDRKAGGLPHIESFGQVTLSGYATEIRVYPTVREAVADLRRAWAGLVNVLLKKSE